MNRPAFVTRILLLILFVAAPLATAEAQKSTIQRRGGGGESRSGSSVSSGGSLRSAPRSSPRSAPAPAISSPSGSFRSENAGQRSSGGLGAPSGRGTLAPDFPLRGRGGEGRVQRSAPAGRFPTVSREDLARRGSRPRADLRRSARLSRGTDEGKRFIDVRDPRSRRGSRSFHDQRWRHVRRDDGVRILIYQPYFYDPFTRYRYFDRYRYFGGFGCGYYDRYFPGYYGSHGLYRHAPCFSSFGLYLGWPWIYDPWPGFWSYPYYGDYSEGSPRFDYRQGYDEGYDRGYAAGDYEDDGYDDGYEDDDPFLAAYRDPASALLIEARRRIAAGDYERALDAFEGYVRENPDDPSAYLSTGLALTALGHYGKAADEFRQALDAAQPGERPYLDAPALFGSRRDFRRVLGELQAYVRSHADNRDARFDLGMVYFLSGERGSAASLFRGLRNDLYARYLLEDLLIED